MPPGKTRPTAIQRREADVQPDLHRIAAEGDITHLPKWIKSKKRVVHQGYPAMELAGQYERGTFGKVRMRRKGRIVVVGKRGYFAHALYPPGDPAAARAADYFLSSFKLIPGKQQTP